MCQLNLQLALVGTGALGKDIENQTGTIKHATLQLALDIAFLTGGKGVIEQHQLSIVLSQCLSYFVEFSGADKQAGIGVLALTGDKGDGISPGRCHQLHKLIGVFAGVLTVEIQVDKYRAFTGIGAFK